MVAQPWFGAQPIGDPNREYVALLTVLVLKTHATTFVFFPEVARVLRSARRSHGLIGYSVASEFLARRYSTLSTWEDHNSLQAFVASSAHRRAMQRLEGRLALTRFVEWRTDREHLPPTWADARKRLSQPT